MNSLETVELLKTLIAIPSVNPMGRNVSIQDGIYGEGRLTNFLQHWLTGIGLTVRRQTVSEGRDNIIATYESNSSPYHLIMEAHQDTVPVDGMIVDPFHAKLEGSRLYGRGSCDVKGPMTAMLLCLKRLQESNPKNSCSVTLVLAVDEEHSHSGIDHYCDQLNQEKKNSEYHAAIIAEPTNLNLVTSHKGAVRWIIETKGIACHSSAPDQGQNAIYSMADVIHQIETLTHQLELRTPHEELGKPTISIGVIEGGACVNMVAEHCEIQIDRRLLPGEDAKTAIKDVRDTILKAPNIDENLIYFQPPWVQTKPFDGRNNIDFLKPLKECIIPENDPCHCYGVPFGTDAGFLANCNIPSVVFGPGSIDQAHTKDEWIDIPQIEKAIEILFRYCTEGFLSHEKSIDIQIN